MTGARMEKKLGGLLILLIPFMPFPKTPSLSHGIIWREEGLGTRPLTDWEVIRVGLAFICI